MPITVTSTWQSAQPVDVNILVEKVARLYGLSSDADAQRQALDFLDETVKDFNQNVFEFMLVEATGLALTSAQRYISLPTQFYKEKLAYLVRTSDSSRGTTLAYLDWVTFERLYGPSISIYPGDPEVYSVFNQSLEGRLYLGPTPSSGTASGYTLTLQYYRRIELPSTVTQLNVPQEVENALLFGAKKRFALEVAGPDSSDWTTFQALENDAMAKLRSIDRRHPDEVTRFRLYDRFGGANYRDGSIYIRIR